jgi:hypothetical protein
MDLMSERFGMSYFLLLVHQAGETVEQVADVVRAGRGFRVALEAERRLVGAGQALQRAVEQRDVRGAQVVGQRLLVHREAVVLAGDAHAAGIEVLHRVVGAVVAELHLEGLGAGGQRHDLVAQADAEGGIAVLDQLARGVDRVVAGLRVAGAVGEEHAVRLELLHFGGRASCAGTTVTLQPRSASMRRMFCFTP